MTLVELKPPSPLPPDLPAQLRALADRVETGLVTEMVIGWVERGDYSFLWPSSLNDSLILATLLQATAIDKYRK